MSLSVIVFTRDDAEHLSRCLSTLRDDRMDAVTEVIVVDNASTDRTAEVLEGFAESLPLLVLSLEVDTSFSAGNNLGLARSCGEYVLFLNPDTLPTATVLSVCMEELKTSRDVGLVGPRLVHPGGVDQDNGPLGVSLRGAQEPLDEEDEGRCLKSARVAIIVLAR